MQKLTERIFYLPHDDTTDRPTLGYIRGDRFSLMVDAGSSARHVALFESERAAHGLPAPDFVALTHWHWDHTYGLCAVQALSFANSVTNERLAAMQSWQWNEEAMAARVRTGEDIEFATTMIAKEYPDLKQINIKKADVVFADRLDMDLGGVSCTLLRLDGPHSADNTVLYVPGEKVVFLGDAVYCSGYEKECYNKDSLGRLIALLASFDFAIAVDGHNRPMEKAELLSELE